MCVSSSEECPQTFFFKLEIDTSLFEFFINNSNKEVSISSLKKNVWGHSSELETHTVETHVYRLRKKIKDFFNDSKFIKSTDNGYKI